MIKTAKDKINDMTVTNVLRVSKTSAASQDINRTTMKSNVKHVSSFIKGLNRRKTINVMYCLCGNTWNKRILRNNTANKLKNVTASKTNTNVSFAMERLNA